MPETKFKVAKGCFLWLLDFKKWDGWTSFWNTVYLREEHFDNVKLRKHELKHIEQIEKEGRIKYLFKYTFFNIKYGYWNNPYEIEARGAEND